MYNIFQGNELIKQVIVKTLEYDSTKEYLGTSFTSDMYFQAFFYLSKRFGAPSRFDDGKEAGAWSFKVKHYVIQIRLNSHWVEFMIYGKIGNTEIHSPYFVKMRRQRMKKRDQIINETGEWNETEKKLADDLFKKFCVENEVADTTTKEQWNEQFSMKWFDCICDWNKKVINIDYKEIETKYGNLYQNAYTSHALKTLEQFLKNMLSPISVRDVSYNIKGRISDERAEFYSRYENNIKIEFQP